jgi:3-oxoadipate enol-lactonase/4-carboxymuconolactone decarboxylase
VEMAGALGVKKFCFCGLSMGGAVGQWLAIHTPGLLSRLVLSNTSPQFGTRETWEARLQALREGGMKAIADTAMQRFFSSEKQTSVSAQSVRAVLLGTDPVGYSACCAALRDFNNRNGLGQIKAPTLVITGNHDPSTPWEGNGEILAREIPGAKVVRFPGAHLSNLAQPRSYTAALLEFLLQESPGDPLEAGLRVRRQVLGDAHVDRTLAAANDFNRYFQMLITRYAWGAVWTRPGLDHHTRRLLVLAMTSALGRWEEFRLHLRAALAHGMESCDVKEVLLQVAIYAGVPAANTGFQIAREEMKTFDTETQ